MNERLTQLLIFKFRSCNYHVGSRIAGETYAPSFNTELNADGNHLGADVDSCKNDKIVNQFKFIL